jgi:cytochrome c-type biogenesis protein CcsB
MLDTVLIWFCIYCYALATILLLTGFVFNKEKLLAIAGCLILPGFVAHTVLFAMRWARTGWFPANGELENSITACWFAVAFTIYLFIRRRTFSGVELFTIPAALLLMGFGVMKAPSPLPMVASLKSSWLIIHVLFAQLAFGAYAIAAGFGLVHVLKERRIRREGAAGFYGRFPRPELLDELMFKFVIYGFIGQAIMIVAGSIWAKDLWGSYWAWDPVEVWSLVSWLLYGFSIHLRVTLGWRGRRQAWLMIVLFSTVIITGWGVNIVVKNSQHIFGVVS